MNSEFIEGFKKTANAPALTDSDLKFIRQGVDEAVDSLSTGFLPALMGHVRSGYISDRTLRESAQEYLDSEYKDMERERAREEIDSKKPPTRIQEGLEYGVASGILGGLGSLALQGANRKSLIAAGLTGLGGGLLRASTYNPERRQEEAKQNYRQLGLDLKNFKNRERLKDIAYSIADDNMDYE